MINVSHIRTLSSIESTTSSPSIRLAMESIWNYAGNTLVNQHSDINKTHEILQDESKCEMIVVIENFMTSSAKYADILLEDLMTVEQEDIIPNDYAGNMGYLIFLQPVTSEKFGANDGNSPDDIANTKLVVMFGNNPAETRMSGGGVTYYVEQARERSNARMIVIDPRYNDTAAGREDEWLPIRPGTDGALACAIAWVLITENMVDQPFLDKYCVGYDEKTLPANAPRNAHYKAYILGEGPDGIAKTPEWAAKITSIPAEKIIQLAREIGSAKPAYICQGWGPQRHSNGEQTSRAIAMLSVLTGNVGINGGNSGVREGSWDLGVEWFPMLENPVKTQISVFTWTDAIDHGTKMTATRDGVRGKEKLDVPIKFLWCYASNTLINQHGDINHTHEVLQDDSKCEMIVGIDHFMTASAKYCDILLPDLMPTEQEDLISHESAGNMGYVILAQPATSAKFERKPIYWMLSEVAKPKRVPTPATAILMCYSRPAHKRCGSTPLMLRHAVSVMAIPCGYLTIMEKC